MKMRSVISHSFAVSPQANIPRSVFNRSHGCKTTFDAGYLIPVFLDEALPGDTFNCHMTAFARMATPLFPIMDNAYMDSFFFAVQYRLVWDNWQRMNGEQDNPTDSTDYILPTMTAPSGGFAEGSLSDYFGIPTKVVNLEVQSLFHRAYNLIWNEWFRDENLNVSVPVPKDDGPDVESDFVLQRRGKRYDYFTSSLPFPQKGPAVQLLFSGNAPVTGIGTTNLSGWNSGDRIMYETDGTGRIELDSGKLAASTTLGAEGLSYMEDPNNPGYPNIRADLSAVTAATINQLREAFQVQKLYERDARGGTRYIEIIRSHFGVSSPDARLQRPEYLGGGSTPINIHPVAQTSSSNNISPQGNLAAFGTTSLSGHGFTKSFTEHCLIIGMVSVRADLTYQQGLNRMFSRSTRFDFYWPALSHLGEQTVLNKEIFAQGTAADEEVFGYQERYAEYRYKPSIITGQFRSNAETPLDSWHLSQDYADLPVLGAGFIAENPSIERVVAVPDEPHFIFDSFFKLKCARPMPTYAVPGLVDHF